MTAKDRTPEPGDVLLGPPHPKAARPVRLRRKISGVCEIGDTRMFFYANYEGSRHGTGVAQERWGEWEYLSRADGVPVFPLPGEMYQHVKTGGRYMVICMASEESSETPVVVYRDVEKGATWTRPACEFLDGRFVRL